VTPIGPGGPERALDPLDVRPATTGRSAVGNLRDGRGEAIVYVWPMTARLVMLVTWTKEGQMSSRIERWD
jgi:hypothetical protein